MTTITFGCGHTIAIQGRGPVGMVETCPDCKLKSSATAQGPSLLGDIPSLTTAVPVWLLEEVAHALADAHGSVHCRPEHYTHSTVGEGSGCPIHRRRLDKGECPIERAWRLYLVLVERLKAGGGPG